MPLGMFMPCQPITPLLLWLSLHKTKIFYTPVQTMDSCTLPKTEVPLGAPRQLTSYPMCLLRPLSMISKPICLMPMLPMWHWTTTNLVTIAPCSTRQQMAASHGNPLQRVFQMERSYGDWFKITLIHNCCF